MKILPYLSQVFVHEADGLAGLHVLAHVEGLVAAIAESLPCQMHGAYSLGFRVATRQFCQRPCLHLLIIL